MYSAYDLFAFQNLAEKTDTKGWDMYISIKPS